MISAIAPFDAIAIDKKEIPQRDLDIQNKVRSNLAIAAFLLYAIFCRLPAAGCRLPTVDCRL